MALQLADFEWQSLADGEDPARISGNKIELAVQRGYASPITERVISIPDSKPTRVGDGLAASGCI